MRLGPKTYQKTFQQFYSADYYAKRLIGFTSIMTNENEVISVLEPTAGPGNLIKYLYNNYPNKGNLSIFACDICPTNRKLLKSLLETNNDVLYNEPDFLKLENEITSRGDKFDYIIMNPPFHLRIEEFSECFTINGGDWPFDVYDIDFILQARKYLKPNGELVSGLYTCHLNRDLIKLNGWKCFLPEESSLDWDYMQDVHDHWKSAFLDSNYEIELVDMDEEVQYKDNSYQGINYKRTVPCTIMKIKRL